MEVTVFKALKPSLRREFIFQQSLCDEILCFNANTVVGGEEFSVDDLLDFSNGEFQHGSLHYGEEIHSLSFSSLSQDRAEDDSNSNSTGVSYDSFFSGELAVPDDDVAELEWVSHFVDDSLSLPEPSLLYPVISEKSKTLSEPAKETPRFHTEKKNLTKARRTTKNRKPNASVWLRSPVLSRPSSPSSCFSVISTVPPVLLREPPAKKLKTMAPAHGEAQGGAQTQLQQRSCSHCQVQKTPQWRTGPLGAKTLCNACGVRYKSGRLFAEYRPACSPTFSSKIHSNSHRKVLEIRKRKGMVGPEPGLAPTQMVPTC